MMEDHISRMSIIDVVKWDASPNVLAWKYPSSELSTWTQLIVSESQEAILLKEGQFVGPFAPGRHTLSSENYPILATIYKIPFGRSPFTAEVWFVQKVYTLDVKWGTVTPIQIEDPKYNLMLPVSAFGQYGLQIENSRMFLSKLVGTLPAFTVKTIQSHFKGIIMTLVKDTIAKYLLEKHVSILQISARLSELSGYIEGVLVEMLAEYGVKVCNFCVESVSTDDSDPAVARLKRALAERAEMNIIGFNYHEKRSFDVMETAVGNEGAGGVQSSVLGAGMGMALGMGLGQTVGDQASRLSPRIDTGAGMRVCSKCGATNQSDARFCCNCGQMLVLPKQFCPGCGMEVPPDARFCTHCGNSIV